MAFSELLHKASVSPDLNTNREIIGWWEKKRILYNAVMLVFGSVTLLIGYLCVAFRQMFPWIGLIFFAISANIFYTAGWIIDIAGRKYLSDQPFSRRLSPILFLTGTVFSVFLTFAIDVAMLIALFSETVSHK